MNRHAFFLALAGALTMTAAWADEPVLPGQGYDAARYENLWTKSPFSVATAEAATDSPDYSLTGVFQIEGVSYAGLINKQNNEHFLVSSNKPARGLKLVSITNGHDASASTAVIQKGGETMTLKVEEAPMGAPGTPPGQPNVPGMMPGNPLPTHAPQIPMPGSNYNPYNNGQFPPRAGMRTRTVHLPPQPQPQQQPPAAPPTQPPPAGEAIR